MEDVNTVIFDLSRELVAELQYSNVEGYIESDSLILVEELASKKICGSFLLIHQRSKLSALTESVLKNLQKVNVSSNMRLTTQTIVERARQNNCMAF